MSDLIGKEALSAAFPPAQAEALTRAFEGLKDSLAGAAIHPKELEDLRAMLKSLSDRLDRLAPPDDVSPEVLAVIGAAVAAYFGKRVRIRQARLVSNSSAWAQTGRVWRRASPRWSVQVPSVSRQ